MFTKPSVNQIEQAYTGNYKPLAAKVEQDKKQHGGIPQDLRQLLALNDLISNQNSAGIQQALNAPVDMPTVAQSAQQQAQQILQARMMQQAQQQQRKEGLPMVVPQGAPQPKMQPQGIDSIPTDVGSGYADGGIIGFSGTKGSDVKDEYSDEPLGMGDLPKRPTPIASLARLISEAVARKKTPSMMLEESEAPDITPPKAKPPVVTDSGAVSNQPAPAADVKPPAPKPALFRDTGAMPAAAGRPSAGLDAYLATPEKNLANIMNVNPDETIKGGIDMYNKYVGSPSTVGIDRMVAELERRKAKLEGQAPQPGLGGLMDYLENIANAGGRTWYEAGTKGGMLQKANQKAREEQINALIEKGIDLAQKKEDVAYGVKKEGFGVGLKEMQEAVKRKYDSAIALATNDLKREELKQQRDLELRKIAAMHVNPALQIAAALQNAKTPEQKDAIMQGIAGVYGNKPTGPTSAMLNQYYDRLKDIDKSFEGDPRRFLGPKEQQALEDAKNAKYKEVYKEFAQYNIGPMAQGGGAGAGTATAVPLPPDAKTNPSKLVVGTIYQTAQGPGKWNGRGFDPQ